MMLQIIDPARIDMLQWTLFAVLAVVVVLVVDRINPFIQKGVQFIQPSESEQAAQFHRIRKMFRKAIIGWLVIDKDRKVVLWSPRMVKKFGWTEHEALGKTLDDLIVPDEAKDAHRQKFQHFVDTGKSDIIGNKFGYNIECVTKDKKRIPVRLILSDISENGVIEIGGYVFDRTQELERETSYKRTIAQLETAEEIANIGWWFWDLDRTDDITEVSTNFRRIFELDMKVPVTSSMLMESIWHEDQVKTAAAIVEARKEKRDYDVVYRRQTKDGTVQEIIVQAKKILDEYGEVKAYHGIIQLVADV